MTQSSGPAVQKQVAGYRAGTGRFVRGPGHAENLRRARGRFISISVDVVRAGGFGCAGMWPKHLLRVGRCATRRADHQPRRTNHCR